LPTRHYERYQVEKKDISVKNTNKKKDLPEIFAGTVESCVNTPVEIESISGENLVVKVPVVLAELDIQCHVSAKIKLPEPALEVKDINKKLKITQCLLLQDTNILFIKGFVRKNIEYATVGSRRNEEGVCGEIRHCTVDVPFECTTPVTFNGIEPAPVVATTSFEFQYLRKEDLPSDFASKDKLPSGDLSEFNQISTEYYNDLPYCDIVSSRIMEFNEYLNRKKLKDGPFEEKTFDEIHEKMVINLIVKILQERQVEL